MFKMEIKNLLIKIDRLLYVRKMKKKINKETQKQDNIK